MEIKPGLGSIEQQYLNQISGLLPHFAKQSNSYRLKCPYCQHGSKDHKGRPMSPSRCKGYFYQVGNALNYKCHHCGVGMQFHSFLEDHFPKVFLAYVAERDGLGLTGKGTNAPTLSNAADRVAERVAGAPKGIDGNMDAGVQETACGAAGVEGQGKQSQSDSMSQGTALTKLPRLTPQQQAGCSARLAHKVKQHQQRRHMDPATRYLMEQEFFHQMEALN
jgi:hypothetical protein